MLIVENDYRQRVHMEDSSLKINNNDLKRRYIRAGISAVFICFMVIIGYIFLARATKRDSSDFKYRPFFEEDTDYDVMFFGTSHVINGVFPMQLWNDYGITSYNFGGHASSLSASYWVMVNATKEKKPKVAVLDVLGSGQQYKSTDLSYFHVSMDAFPLSFSKLEAVNDVFEENYGAKIEILQPFSIYHNRWDEFNRYSIKQGLGIDVQKTKEKGAESRIQVAVPNEMELISELDYSEDESVGLEYIKKFIEYCRENEIVPVVINIPYPASKEAQLWANAAIKMAEDMDVTAINMQYGEVVDFDTDCYDSNSHLNPSGARKVTELLGKVLTQNFELEDKRENAEYESWNEAYEEYYDFLVNKMINQNDYKITLMLLNNSNFKADIVSKQSYSPDDIEKKLIDQLGNNVTFRRAQYIATEDGDSADIKVTIYNKDSGEKIVDKFYNSLEKMEFAQ